MDHVHARPERRLRRLGVAWQCRLVVDRTCCRCSRRVEDYQHGADDMHGAGGELRVEETWLRWEILEAWRDAAEDCGIPKIGEFNRGDNVGSAFFQMNQKRGVRWHATKAFLRPALSRPNLTVMTHALVERVKIWRRYGATARRGDRVSTPAPGTMLRSGDGRDHSGGGQHRIAAIAAALRCRTRSVAHRARRDARSRPRRRRREPARSPADSHAGTR